MGFSGDYDWFGNFVVKFPEMGVSSVLYSLNSLRVRDLEGNVDQTETDRLIKLRMNSLPRVSVGGYFFNEKTHQAEFVEVNNDKKLHKGKSVVRQTHRGYTLKEIIRAGIALNNAKKKERGID